MAAHLFLSYAHTDESYIRVLAQRMEEAGLEPWYYVESQRAGIDFTERLLASIEQARAMVIVLSAASASSEFVLQEVLYAKKLQKLIIPISLEPCEGTVVFHLSARNWIKCWDGRRPVPKILEVLSDGAVLPALPLADDYAQLVATAAYLTAVRPTTYLLDPPTNSAPLELPTSKQLCTLGRSPRNDLVISLDYVSRTHARISMQLDHNGRSFVLHDEGSSRGTFVNGKRLEGPQTLYDGDQIGLGSRQGMLRFACLGLTGEGPDTAEAPDKLEVPQAAAPYQDADPPPES